MKMMMKRKVIVMKIGMGRSLMEGRWCRDDDEDDEDEDEDEDD
jgi:hypothetical protein